MEEPSDHELLAAFARRESEEAFTALVARHVNLVHSTALRFTANLHHAEEITQAVFILLSRKAAKLPPRIVLPGWLYQTTRLTAAGFARGESRRRKREWEACMRSTLDETPPPAWDGLTPLLDEAMGRLRETDRNAIVLRFFDNRTARETGAALGLTEAAAQKRVTRALEKLRKILAQRGAPLPDPNTGAPPWPATQPTPVGFAATVAASAANNISPPPAITLLIKETMNRMTWLKLKFATGLCIAALATGGVTIVAMSQTSNSGDSATTPPPRPRIGTMGFAGVLEVHSIATSVRKMVFIVSGPVELLQASDDIGTAQQVHAFADHTAIVLYRNSARFPTEKDWQDECGRVKALVGAGIYFHMINERLTWEASDLTLVTADNLVVKKESDTR